jgi:hypothetical protein
LYLWAAALTSGLALSGMTTSVPRALPDGAALKSIEMLVMPPVGVYFALVPGDI